MESSIEGDLVFGPRDAISNRKRDTFNAQRPILLTLVSCNPEPDVPKVIDDVQRGRERCRT